MSNKEVTKLLTVLDMSEDEQRDFVRNILIDTYHSNWMLDQWDKGRFSLADLAFRLRDEADVVGNLHKGIKAVCDAKCPKGKEYLEWWMYEAKPIHWIIAALLAKESK